jgi:hypothetical protein
MTDLDILLIVLAALATPAFIAFEIWHRRQKHKHRQQFQ